MRADALAGGVGGAGRVSKELDTMLGFEKGSVWGGAGVRAGAVEESVKGTEGNVEGLFN